MINTISEILKITKEEDLLSEFQQFESALDNNLQALKMKLDSSLTNTDTSQIQNHMCFVESWRDRVTKYNALVTAFVEHAKSSYFIMPAGKGITAPDRDAHQKKLLAGFLGMKSYTEELIRSIDSRVNLSKVLLRIETTAPNVGFK